ncbi:MAG: TolC family protein [Planctomycetota bacterium]|nr:MAG: TolC family protein [Planctomycetota bacterium]
MRPLSAAALLALLSAACSAPPPPVFADRQDAWEAAAARSRRADEPLPERPDLAALWTYAQEHNPGLRAALQDWRQALEVVPAAASLPDPRLSLAFSPRPVETRNGPAWGRLGLHQAFPWFGSLDDEAARAFAAAEAAREAWETARNRVRAELAEAWFEYAWLAEATEITRGNLDLLRHLEAVSRTLYETGEGSQADLIRAQVEIGRLEDRLKTLEDLRRPLSARIRAVLGRPGSEPLPWPTAALPDAADLGRADELAAGLAATNPELRALAFRIEAARRGVRLAEKDFYPDFVLGAEWTWIGPSAGASDSGDDALGLSFGLDLPFRRARLRAQEAGARAGLAAAERRLDDRRNQLQAGLEMALYRHRDAARRVALYRQGLIAKSEESFQSTLAAYQTALAPFDAVIDAARLLLEFQLAAVRAEADRAQAAAELERITGRQLLPF